MGLLKRASAKVLLVDADCRVLLFSAIDASRPEQSPFWFPTGGGVEAGESLEDAAIREVFEETGLELGEVGSPVMTRSASFEFEDTSYEQEETYFIARVSNFVPTSAGWTDLEQRSIASHRWWSVEELRSTDETVFPEGLVEVLDQISEGLPQSFKQ